MPRDSRGRFAKRGAEEPKELSAPQLAILRAVPEVACVAVPGERIGEAVCQEGHYLVQFWPLLGAGPVSTYEGRRYVTKPSWMLGAPLTFDIDTTQPSDPARGDGGGYHMQTHFALPVRLRMGERG